MEYNGEDGELVYGMWSGKFCGISLGWKVPLLWRSYGMLELIKFSTDTGPLQTEFSA